MENWKKAIIAGSAGASAVMFLRRRSAAGVIFAGISVAALASEYPQKFVQLRKDLPDYLDRGTRFLEVVSRVGERVAELAQRGRRSAWDEVTARLSE
jgi:hypothetical protein